MATPLVREWTGIHEFPAATQTKLFELLEKLKEKYFWIMRPMGRLIKNRDVPLWEQRDLGWANGEY